MNDIDKELEAEKKYIYNGEKVTLFKMQQKVPEWVLSRFRFMEEKIKRDQRIKEWLADELYFFNIGGDPRNNPWMKLAEEAIDSK